MNNKLIDDRFDERNTIIKELKEKLDEILKYCEPHLEQMWAATIVSNILECDFRDAKHELQKIKKV